MVQALVQAMVQREEERKFNRKLVGMLGMLAAAACILGSVSTKDEQRRLQDGLEKTRRLEEKPQRRLHGVHVYDEYCHDRDDDEYCHEGLAMECQPNHDDPTHEHCDVTDKLDNKFCDGCSYDIQCKDGTVLVDEDGNKLATAVTKNEIEIVHKAINKQKAFEGKCKKVTVSAFSLTGSTAQKAKKIQLLLQRNHPNKDWINNGNGNMGYCPCKLGYCGGCGCHGNCRRLQEEDERRLQDGLEKTRRLEDELGA